MERSSQYTSFSSKKQPANARSERKQFTENASVALEQTVLTHAHTKCPSVVPSFMSIFCFSKSKYRKGNMQLILFLLSDVPSRIYYFYRHTSDHPFEHVSYQWMVYNESRGICYRYQPPDDNWIISSGQLRQRMYYKGMGKPSVHRYLHH